MKTAFLEYILAIGMTLGWAVRSQASEPDIIPRPAFIRSIEGTFLFPAHCQIVADESMRSVGSLLRDILTKIGTDAVVVALDPRKPASVVSVRAAARADLGMEGYTLDIDSNGIQITANSPAGAFYAVQSLRQMLPADIETPAGYRGACRIPCVQVVDQPRYRWRGLMLDVSRHFRDVAYVKRFLDLMALHKLNVFHWHLTDDQGWRIEIRKYPKLTGIGAWRDDGRGGRYGGFYTQQQIRDVVAYAAERYITIVPEIEMPGHSAAALAAYPELSISRLPTTVPVNWHGNNGIYCAGREFTFTFLEDVLTEVMELFPSHYIHIGGDEVNKRWWKGSPDDQARMKALHLKSEDELQSYFIRRIDTFVSGKGRNIIGWDEILQGGLAPGAAVMSWRGMQGGITAIHAGHDVVMSPSKWVYLDHYQAADPDVTTAKSVILPLETVYRFDPTPAGLTAAEAARVLGGQGNLWAENLDSDRRTDYMAFPRACALAEVLWTPSDRHDWSDFTRRLPVLLDRLDRLGVYYYKPGSHVPTTQAIPIHSTKH